MSNKNSRGKRKECSPIEEAIIEQPIIEEAIIEQPIIEETVEIQEEPKTGEFLDGVVFNCIKLNVRKEPSLDSEVITVLNETDRVKIEAIDNSQWYHIQLPNGEEGFSMKKYIAVGV